MKRTQLKSYFPISIVCLISGVVNRHISGGTIDNISYSSDYTPYIHTSGIDRAVADFTSL